MSASSPDSIPISPYPGLRSFARDEARLFFGREDHTDELLEKLSHKRFLAVVGPSGCGKSSLIRAGMMAALEGGLMSGAGGRWVMAEMRPGNRPISALAKALLEVDLLRQHLLCVEESFEDPPPTLEESEALLRATLRAGPLGMCNVLKEAKFPERTNFLLLVDQFEELFAARREGFANETEAFVAALLETVHFRELPLYVVITMRSDYLGDCPIFSGLPEAINQSQFLTPRLNRDERETAIVGPARLFDTTIDPELVNHLLNKAGPSPDQLPLLQHLLMRMWTLAGTRRAEGAPTLEIGFDHYNAAGGFECALSKHAGEAYGDLTESRKKVTEVLFRSICERDQENREKRRLVSVETIAALAAVSCDEVALVADVFRRPDRSFLMPPINQTIGPETTLDISHEALIRNWDTLSEWVAAELDSAEKYRFLEQTARRWKKGEAALWSTPDLESALAWKEREKPSEKWAARYGGEFLLAMDFLDRSEKNHAEKIRRREERRSEDEERLRELARQQSLRAEAEHRRAEAEKQRAEEERKRAEAERERAKTEKRLAEAELERSRQEAEAKEQRAEAERDRIRRRWRRRFITAGGVALLAASVVLIVYFRRESERHALLRHTTELELYKAAAEKAKLEDAQRLKDVRTEAERLEHTKLRTRTHLVAAESRLKTGGPKGKVLALHYVSLALRVDALNPDAAKLAAELLGSNNWCPPLTPSYRCGSSPIHAASFSPDGKHIIAISQDGRCWQWNAEGDSQPVITFWNGKDFAPTDAAPPAITSPGGDKVVLSGASFSPDGRNLLVAISSRSHLRVGTDVPQPRPPTTAQLLVWSDRNMKHGAVGELFTIKEGFRSAAWRKDGRMFATVPRGWDGGIELFHVKDEICEPVKTQLTQGKIATAEFDPEGAWLATASSEGIIELWDAAELESPVAEPPVARKTYRPPVSVRPFALVFGPDKNEISEVCFNEPLRIWNLKSDVRREVSPSANDQIMRFAPAPGRDRAAVSYNSRVVLAEATSLNSSAEPICPQGAIAFPVFSPDGKKLLTLSGAIWNAMDTVRVWRSEVPIPPIPANKLGIADETPPKWLAELAEAVSGQRIVSDDEGPPPALLHNIAAKYGDVNQGPYDLIWRRFFPATVKTNAPP